jgi:hypothetical protein
MAKTIAKAVIMGEKSGTDHLCEFEVDDGFFSQPADDIVDRFIDHLHQSHQLPDRNGYELNSAIRSPAQTLVTGLGHLHFSNQEVPFMVMIYPKPD